MKRKIVILFLMVILATSYIVTWEQIINYKLALRDRPQQQEAITEKPKARQPRQQVELSGYPAPEEWDYPFPPVPWYRDETPFPTPTFGPLPTPAPTMSMKP